MVSCTQWGKGVRFLVGCGIAVGIVLGIGMIPADAVVVRTVTKREDSETTEGTLRYWVKNAAAGDIIAFSGAGTAVNLTSMLTLNNDLVLAGPATITQTGSGCVFRIPSGQSVGMSNLTIASGKNAYSGGGVANAGTLTMNGCTVRNSSAEGAGGGVWNDGALTMKDCVIGSNTSKYAGGGVGNIGNLTMEDCTVSGNTSTFMTQDGGGISTSGTATIKRCTITGNTADYGGGVQNRRTMNMYSSTVTGNTARKAGGGIFAYYNIVTKLFGVAVMNNTPDQICGPYSADRYCTIGSAPNKSATAFSGYSGETEPEPRSIAGDDDVAEVKRELADSGSDLFASIEEMFTEDLGRTPEAKTAATSGTAMTSSLYYANTFENVALTSTDLSVEYTASWPESVRYYSLFSRADGAGYEIPGRGVQFEIKAGQSLPDGVTPPDFYVPGEGLMTWRNVVTDGGSYDLNPTAGVVTFRVCSVRAAEAVGDTGSGGGCNASDGFAPLAFLLAAPLCAFVRMKGSIRK